MRREDLNRYFEEAFAKIEPKNEAHREKLAKMRERFKQFDEESVRDLEKAQAELAEMRRANTIDRGSIERAGKIHKETWDALLNASDEQATLIERIANATQNNRSSR